MNIRYFNLYSETFFEIFPFFRFMLQIRKSEKFRRFLSASNRLKFVRIIKKGKISIDFSNFQAKHETWTSSIF